MIISKNTLQIDVPLLKASFVLIDTEKKFNFFVSENKLPGEPCSWQECAGSVYHFRNNLGAYFIMILRNKDAGVIAHEAVHLARFIMMYKGIPIKKWNDEIEAYIVQHIVDEVTAVVKKKRKK